MRMCARCRSEFSDSTLEVCPFDNWGLVKPEDYYEAEGDQMLGALLAGRFRIVSRVGVGAMGTVYKAIQASVDRPVALKVLRPDLTKDAETAARFNREARATSALKHPNTVTLYDFGQTPEGHLYIAMELLEGRLLGKMLKDEGELPLEQAIRIVIQVAKSLAEAHRKGIVHRDLKPDNIMLAQVEGQEMVKVLDFGIAKIVHGARHLDALETQAGTVFGTPRYMSPEQAQSNPLDARTDIYSLGVIFYQMLTGKAPFEDADAVVVMARHIKTKPRRPTDVRPDIKIPRQIERLVMRMVEKDRNKRPQSAEELVDILTRFTHQLADEDLAVFSEPSSVRRQRSMIPLVAILGSVAFLATGAMIAFALSRPPAGTAEVAPAETAETARLIPADTREKNVDPLEEPQPETVNIEVTLDSEPTGATVLRDGKALGATPMMITEPLGSSVAYTFELEGYQTEESEITFSRGASTKIVSLVPERPIKTWTGPVKRGPRRPVKQPTDVPATEPDETPSKTSGYGRFDG